MQITGIMAINESMHYGVVQTGSSGLMYAAYNGHSGCVEALLGRGADITLENEDGHTAFTLAVNQGHKQGGTHLVSCACLYKIIHRPL